MRKRRRKRRSSSLIDLEDWWLCSVRLGFSGTLDTCRAVPAKVLYSHCETNDCMEVA
uniref:Uncharacterized protein n=1 Tax=Anguilla anguilla TaxID=7936 RepID=A0A0E9XCQ3_ANGAN